jgi:hypothetical protein
MSRAAIRRQEWARCARRIERSLGTETGGELMIDTATGMLTYLTREELVLLAWLYAAGAPE